MEFNSQFSNSQFFQLFINEDLIAILRLGPISQIESQFLRGHLFYTKREVWGKHLDHIPAFGTGVVGLGTVQDLMDNHAFLQLERVCCTTSRGLLLFGGSGRLVAHFMHIVWSWPRRAGTTAPVVGIIDTH